MILQPVLVTKFYENMSNWGKMTFLLLFFRTTFLGLVIEIMNSYETTSGYLY